MKNLTAAVAEAAGDELQTLIEEMLEIDQSFTCGQLEATATALVTAHQRAHRKNGTSDEAISEVVRGMWRRFYACEFYAKGSDWREIVEAEEQQA